MLTMKKLVTVQLGETTTIKIKVFDRDQSDVVELAPEKNLSEYEPISLDNPTQTG